MGQTQVQDTVAAQAAPCGLAAPDEERISNAVLPLECRWGKGWVMGAV